MISRSILIQQSYDLAKNAYGSRKEFRVLLFIVITWVLNEVIVEFVDTYVAKSNRIAQRVKKAVQDNQDEQVSKTKGRVDPSSASHSLSMGNTDNLTLDQYNLWKDAKSWSYIIHIVVQVVCVVRIYTMTTIAYMVTDTFLSTMYAGTSDVQHGIIGFVVAYGIMMLIGTVRNEIATSVKLLVGKQKCPPA